MQKACCARDAHDITLIAGWVPGLTCTEDGLKFSGWVARAVAAPVPGRLQLRVLKAVTGAAMSRRGADGGFARA
jgi:hypothetical protein